MPSFFHVFSSKFSENLILQRFFEPDQRVVKEEVAKKKEEFHNDATIRKIFEQCEADKIQFQVEVLQGNVPDVSINASIRLEATSVILDKSVPLSNL
ncbi:hypothetical protein RJT34_02061 [Clitoria ternatea]|uniref:Uncharacterized protein n=1 Tax=Clitoria ternatea TaxID=43366 RepID=A0AAN9KKX2_CLITE